MLVMPWPRGEVHLPAGVTRYRKMPTKTAERRRNIRCSAAYFAVLRDHRNRKELCRGRTADISESGVLVVVHDTDKIPQAGNVCVSITIPADPVAGTKRQVIYRCKIARRSVMGNMVGLGLEFLSKLA